MKIDYPPYLGIGQHQPGDLVRLRSGRVYVVEEGCGGLTEMGETPAAVLLPPALPTSWDQVILPAAQAAQFAADRHGAHYATQAKIRIYIYLHLVKLPKSTSRQAGRCCVEGVNYYARKDGQTPKPGDLDALSRQSIGQVNNVSRDGTHEIKQKWLCDSSD